MTTKHEKILTLGRTRYTEGIDSDKDERKAADEDTRFAINDKGCQWPKDIRTQREGDKPPRPCLVLNKIPEKIDQVEGEFRQLRPAIKVRPVDSVADPKIAEIYGGIIRHIEYGSVARDAYNTAHSSTLYCGRGAWRIDIEDNPDDPFIKDIKVNRIPNVLTVVWQPGAKKKDKSDSNYFFITEELPEDEFKAKYPGVEVMEWDASDDTMQGWRTDKTVRVAEYWWKEKEDKTFYRVKRDLEIMTVTEKREGDQVIGEKTVKVPKVKWCLMIHNKILEDKIHDWPGKYIPIVVEIGKEVNIKGQAKTRGMVRFAIQPQQMYNYWSSTITEQVSLAPKAPYLLSAKMLGVNQPQWDSLNIKNYPYLLYEIDPANPMALPKREQPPQLSLALTNELMRTEHDIMSAMNIYKPDVGDQGPEKSGKAILARQKQGTTGSYSYTDNFHSALTHSTKIIVDLIPYVYDTERVIRILGDDDSEKEIPINARENAPFMGNYQNLSQELMVKREGISEYINDLSVGTYDVRVTIGPSHTTQRQEALEMLVALAEKVPQFGLAAIDLIVKNMDVPGSEELLERAKKLVPPGIRDPEPGEETPAQQEPPPDPKVMLEMKKLELAGITEMRKGFEGQMKAASDAMKAEAAERGTQLNEIMAFVQEVREGMMTQGPSTGGQ